MKRQKVCTCVVNQFETKAKSEIDGVLNNILNTENRKVGDRLQLFFKILIIYAGKSSKRCILTSFRTTNIVERDYTARKLS